jgi:hypothetical protein
MHVKAAILTHSRAITECLSAGALGACPAFLDWMDKWGSESWLAEHDAGGSSRRSNPAG